MNCNCDGCKRNRIFAEVIERVPVADRRFWENLYQQLDGVENDLDYYKAVIDGSWPDADAIIAERRDRAAR